MQAADPKITAAIFLAGFLAFPFAKPIRAQDLPKQEMNTSISLHLSSSVCYDPDRDWPRVKLFR